MFQQEHAMNAVPGSDCLNFGFLLIDLFLIPRSTSFSLKEGREERMKEGRKEGIDRYLNPIQIWIQRAKSLFLVS